MLKSTIQPRRNKTTQMINNIYLFCQLIHLNLQLITTGILKNRLEVF